jgi:hypothetical protein
LKKCRWKIPLISGAATTARAKRMENRAETNILEYMKEE